MSASRRPTQTKKPASAKRKPPPPPPRRDGSRGALMAILVIGGLVALNNAGVLPADWTQRLVVRIDGPSARPRHAEPEPPKPAEPAPEKQRRAWLSREPREDQAPPGVHLPVKPSRPPDEPIARPKRRPPDEPRPEPDEPVARPVAPAPPGLLTADQRRGRLAGLLLPEGFTPEWTGGAAVLNVPANELSRGLTTHRRVALTIDGCWSDTLVPRMLEILAAQEVQATFFLTGTFAGRYPQAVRRIAAAGHEVGNHSLNHPAFTKLSDDSLLEQLAGAERPLLKLAGRAYKPFFRPPFGDRDTRTCRLLIQNGYLPVYWTVDTLDWKKEATAESVLDAVRGKGLEPGAILLTHAGSAATAEALPRLIALLRAKDLEPGPLSGVLQP